MGGLKDKLAGAIAIREYQGLKREAATEDRLDVYQRIDEGIGLEGYLHAPFDAGTELQCQIQDGRS